MYAADVFLKIRIEEGIRRLDASFMETDRAIFAQGEIMSVSLQLVNSGTRDVGEAWIVHGRSDAIYLNASREPLLSAILSIVR